MGKVFLAERGGGRHPFGRGPTHLQSGTGSLSTVAALEFCHAGKNMKCQATGDGQAVACNLMSSLISGVRFPSLLSLGRRDGPPKAARPQRKWVLYFDGTMRRPVARPEARGSLCLCRPVRSMPAQTLMGSILGGNREPKYTET
jgi:hypothetical protein